MGKRFWIRRFAQVYGLVFLVLTIVRFLKTGDIVDALAYGLLWAGISATVFVIARIWQSRRGQHCAICKDTPELATNPETSRPSHR